ncbi:MAG: SDR family NAD(P)-dependent oxidoreductase [Deinococcota bacterium]
MLAMTRVLITGATSGLGLELAKGFQAKGASLVLIGRKPLEELPPKLFGEHNYCQVDLAEEAAMDTVTEFLTARDITSLDVVIHSAGVGYYGNLKDQPTDNIKDLLRINLYAPLALSQALLGHLKACYGRLVFISSIAASLPTPDYAVYSASKAALDGLARNIASECHDCIHVQVIHPGATRTDMHRKSGVPEGQFDVSRFAAPAEVAGDIIQAIDEDRFDVTIGRTNRLIRFLGRYFGGVLETVMRWRIRSRARKQADHDDARASAQELSEQADAAGASTASSPDQQGQDIASTHQVEHAKDASAEQASAEQTSTHTALSKQPHLEKATSEETSEDTPTHETSTEKASS